MVSIFEKYYERVEDAVFDYNKSVRSNGDLKEPIEEIYKLKRIINDIPLSSITQKERDILLNKLQPISFELNQQPTYTVKSNLTLPRPKEVVTIDLEKETTKRTESTQIQEEIKNAGYLDFLENLGVKDGTQSLVLVELYIANKINEEQLQFNVKKYNLMALLDIARIAKSLFENESSQLMETGVIA